MNAQTRIQYHSVWWPSVCRANGWKKTDQAKRREVVLECMRQCGGPLVTTSDPLFRFDETTALRVYLAHLADPASFDKSAEWDRCKADYHTYNRARNADWHERETYGAKGSERMQRQRFGRQKGATGGPLDDLDQKKVRQRHMTTASRHRSKLARDGVKAADQAARSFYTPGSAVPPAGCVILLPPPADLADEPAATYEPEPAYVAQEGGDVPF